MQSLGLLSSTTCSPRPTVLHTMQSQAYCPPHHAVPRPTVLHNMQSLLSSTPCSPLDLLSSTPCSPYCPPHHAVPTVLHTMQSLGLLSSTACSPYVMQSLSLSLSCRTFVLVLHQRTLDQHVNATILSVTQPMGSCVGGMHRGYVSVEGASA